jgi:hypothetical protein
MDLQEISRQYLEQQRTALIHDLDHMGDDDPERPSFAARLQDVIDGLDKLDAGERGPHH